MGRIKYFKFFCFIKIMHQAGKIETRGPDFYDQMVLDTNQERVSGLMHDMGAFDFNSLKRS